MRRRIAIFVALFVSAAAVTSLGQDQPPPTLFSKCSAIRIEFVLGRLTIIPQHRGQIRLTKSPPGSEEISESLQVNNDDVSPVVRYECKHGDRPFILEVINYREVNLLAQHDRDNSTKFVEFRQPLQGDLEVIVHDGQQSREIKSQSFWHLILTERALCETELVPVLEVLRPDWHLVDLTEQVESGLFHAALSKPLISRRYLSELVAQLNSPRFQKRQSADSQLRSCGPAALPFLDSLSRQNLSGEQRMRIDRIRRAISTASMDTAERMTEWLADDEHVWFALLKHEIPNGGISPPFV